jgi:hypothetical protein
MRGTSTNLGPDRQGLSDEPKLASDGPPEKAMSDAPFAVCGHAGLACSSEYRLRLLVGEEHHIARGDSCGYYISGGAVPGVDAMPNGPNGWVQCEDHLPCYKYGPHSLPLLLSTLPMLSSNLGVVVWLDRP